MATPVRLAMVVPSLRGGGLERIVRDLVLELDPARFRVAVFCVNGLGVYADEMIAAGIPVFDCAEPRLRIRGIPMRLIRALARFRPDVIHAHSGTWYPAVVSRIVLRTPRLVFTDHGRYLPEPPGRARVERWCERHSDAVVTVSEALAHYVTSFLSLSSRPRVVPNGIDTSRFGAGARASRARLRAEWGAAESDVVGIVVGRLVPVKNHLGMLDSFARALADAPALRIVLLGGGPLEESIRERAASLGIAHRLRLEGFRRDVPECLCAADFFLLPSHSEGLPMSLLEALAAGLPVVGSDVGGIAQALGEPPAGLLVEPGVTDSLASALVTISNDARLRREFGSRARARAATYSLDGCARRYVEVYDDVLGSASVRDQARRGGHV